MGKIQSALLGAGGAVASAALVGKKAVGQKKTEAEKATSDPSSAVDPKEAKMKESARIYMEQKKLGTPSGLAAAHALSSLAEHREAQKLRGSFQTYESEKSIHKAPFKVDRGD